MTCIGDLIPLVDCNNCGRLTNRVPYNLGVAWNLVDSQQWFVAALAFGLAETGLQLWALVASPFNSTGDEVEYIERSRAGRSFGAEPFLRVPFLPAVAWLCGRIGHSTLLLRLASVLCSVIAMAATAGASARLGGWGVATILCLLLLIVPERVALGSRIWPDVYLAAATSTIALILCLTPSPIGAGPSAALVGMLLAAAVLIRLDALILIPSVAIVWVVVSPVFTPAHASWLIGVPVAAFAAWWLVAAGFLDQRWPDTTWIFNLGITVQESRVQQTDAPITIDDLVERYQSRAQEPASSESTIHWTSYLLSVVGRLRAMVGPDSFVQGKLLAEPRSDEHPLQRRTLSALFRVSVPSLVVVTTVFFAWRPSPAGWLAIPTLSLMIPALLFHARTRYRLPLIYGLVPVLAASVKLAIDRHQSPPPLVAFATVAAVGVLIGLLARRPRRQERL